jgi:hypothetical protein
MLKRTLAGARMVAHIHNPRYLGEFRFRASPDKKKYQVPISTKKLGLDWWSGISGRSSAINSRP